MQNTVIKFAKLFAGLDRAHGSYKIKAAADKGKKVEGFAQTLRQAVNAEHWRKHLAGEEGLGIVPIRDDSTVVFGAIDIDTYDMDIDKLERAVRKNKMPLVVCRTKSGGAHCYLFTAEPIQAKVVRNALSVMAMQLGYAGVEIFPKQESLASKDDVGNWINMPYFDCDNTARYAVHDGKVLNTEQFLEFANKRKVDNVEYLLALEFDEKEVLKGAPPCLQVIAEQGAQEGTRNDALFNFAVYARLRHGDNWKDALDDINQVVMVPPLPSSEVVIVTKSADKKEYFYTCKRSPINNYCNKDICRQREFGIGESGDSADDPGILFDSLTQILTIPPIWIVGINGVRLQLDTDDLISQTRFAKVCAENLRFMPAPIKAGKWRKLLNTLFKAAEIVEAPADAGPVGMFWYHVEQFCTTRANARNRDELMMGKPWHHDMRTYFRAYDLIKYLNQQQFKEFKQHKIYSMFRESKDVSHHQFNCKGKNVQCWSIPQYAGQLEEFDLPEVPEVEC